MLWTSSNMTSYILYQLLKDYIFDNFAAGLLMTQEMKGFCYQGDHTTTSNTKNNLYIYIYTHTFFLHKEWSKTKSNCNFSDEKCGLKCNYFFPLKVCYACRATQFGNNCVIIYQYGYKIILLIIIIYKNEYYKHNKYYNISLYNVKPLLNQSSLWKTFT